MRKTKRFILIFTCAAIVLSLTSCSKKEVTTQPTKAALSPSQVLNLPCDYNDTLSPYSIKSETNFYLVSLVYDSLIKMGEKCKYEPSLAESFNETVSSVTVTLAQKVFSDGSPVTSDDVIYSFESARSSERYSDRLSAFSQAQKKDDKTIIFYTHGSSPNSAALLTFPIVKRENPNIGSGRYYKAESTDSAPILLYNQYYDESKKPEIDSIYLVNCSDYSSALAMYNNYSIDFYYDRMDMGSKQNADGQTGSCKLNNLIYLGLNEKNKYLSDKAFRAAISYSIDQTILCKKAYLGLGAATTVPTPADKYDMGSVIVNSPISDPTNAKAAFKKAGYKYNSLGVKLLDGKKQITLNLLVCSDNLLKSALAREIKTQLANLGVEVNIKSVAKEEYISQVKKEDFDMYIGEVKLTDNFSLECFFCSGDTSYGIKNSPVCPTYTGYLEGTSTLQNFISTFCDENPFIPILYRHSLVYHSNLIKGDFSCYEDDIFLNILDWEYTNV